MGRVERKHQLLSASEKQSPCVSVGTRERAEAVAVPSLPACFPHQQQSQPFPPPPCPHAKLAASSVSPTTSFLSPSPHHVLSMPILPLYLLDLSPLSLQKCGAGIGMFVHACLGHLSFHTPFSISARLTSYHYCTPPPKMAIAACDMDACCSRIHVFMSNGPGYAGNDCLRPRCAALWDPRVPCPSHIGPDVLAMAICSHCRSCQRCLALAGKKWGRGWQGCRHDLEGAQGGKFAHTQL